MAECCDPRAGGEHVAEVLQVDVAVVGDRGVTNPRAGALGQELPGDAARLIALIPERWNDRLVIDNGSPCSCDICVM